jgi:hypothetical protein
MIHVQKTAIVNGIVLHHTMTKLMLITFAHIKQRVVDSNKISLFMSLGTDLI